MPNPLKFSTGTVLRGSIVETPAIQIHAIMSFFYACHNIDRASLIYKVFADEPESMRKHLSDVFQKTGYQVFDLLTNLDAPHRAKLILWIMENYAGFPVASAEGYLQEYKNSQP